MSVKMGGQVRSIFYKRRLGIALSSYWGVLSFGEFFTQIIGGYLIGAWNLLLLNIPLTIVEGLHPVLS